MTSPEIQKIERTLTSLRLNSVLVVTVTKTNIKHMCSVHGIEAYVSLVTPDYDRVVKSWSTPSCAKYQDDSKEPEVLITSLLLQKEISFQSRRHGVVS